MASRGREAARPGEIPARGWRDVLLRVREEIGEDRVGLVAAGVAYYGLLAVFPALAALVSVYGLVADPAEVSAQVARLGALPDPARELLRAQLERIAAGSGSALGWGLVGSVLLSTFSAMKGTSALLAAMNVAYDEPDGRGLLARNALALGLTLGAIVLGASALLIVVSVPALLRLLPWGPAGRLAVAVLPWLLLTGVFLVAVSLLYRIGPHRSRAQWRWVTPGALVATVLWIASSLGFSFYVGHFGSYNQTYGSVGAVVVMLLWFFLSAYVVLAGAELDAEMEHQTARDTTRGEEKPMGERGAYVADTVGEVPAGPWKGEREQDHA
jgi:membrane protein